MIVTLTLNPALDKSTEIDRLVPEKKMRCPQPVVEAGGGGINVSKAIQELGGRSLAVFPAGGVNGDLLQTLVAAEQVEALAIPIRQNTRESFTVSEQQTGKQFRFVLPGPVLSADEVEAIKMALSNLTDLSFLVCSGSLPQDLSPAFLGEVAELAKARGAKLVVDTSGEPLRAALEKGVFLLKPNLTELCSLAGKEYLDGDEIEAAGKDIIRSGRCQVLVVSMGPSGALLVTRDEAKQFRAPVVKKLSTVGAGDSMVAGIVWMLAQDKSLHEAVRFGIACGTAATVNKGSQLFNRQDALRFNEWMERQG